MIATAGILTVIKIATHHETLDVFTSLSASKQNTFKFVRENKSSPVAHKNIDEEIIGGSTLQNLSISASLFPLSIVLITRKNPQADILSDRRLFYLFSTMNLFVLRALNL